MNNPERLSATAAARAIRDGDLSAVELVSACLARADAREPEIKAWLHLDRDVALQEAARLDELRSRGQIVGPLHGVPFGVKDVIDVAGQPGTHNSPLHADRVAVDDAGCVAVLRAAGGIPLGKTDTIEFAAGGRLPKTGNPHRPSHTAGGSSSGSGAAVGDAHVPLSLGTQTGGSVMRPASYCGIYAMKPTWGAVSREGAKQYAPTLDTIGWYARDIADLDLLADLYELPGSGADAKDVRGLRLAVCRTPYLDAVDADARAVLDAAADALSAAGADIVSLELSAPLSNLDALKEVIMRGEGRASFLPHGRAYGDRLHDGLRSHVENRTGISPSDLRAALDDAAQARLAYEALYRDVDAVLTFGASGEADEGHGFTGNPKLHSLWTVLHTPIIAVPAGKGSTGLPIGIQLVGFRYADRDLVDVARAVAGVFATG